MGFEQLGNFGVQVVPDVFLLSFHLGRDVTVWVSMFILMRKGK